MTATGKMVALASDVASTLSNSGVSTQRYDFTTPFLTSPYIYQSPNTNSFLYPINPSTPYVIPTLTTSSSFAVQVFTAGIGVTSTIYAPTTAGTNGYARTVNPQLAKGTG